MLIRLTNNVLSDDHGASTLTNLKVDIHENFIYLKREEFSKPLHAANSSKHSSSLFPAVRVVHPREILQKNPKWRDNKLIDSPLSKQLNMMYFACFLFGSNAQT